MTTAALVAIGLALLLTGLVSSIAGGGGGPIIILILQAYLGTHAAIAATAIIITVLLIAKSWQFWKDIDWNAALHYSVIGLPATFLGGVLLFMVPVRFIEVLFSLVCLGFVAFRLLTPHVTLRPTRKRWWVFGAINGFLGGLVGNTGAMLMMAFTSMGYSKERLVGTTAMIGLILEIGQLSAYVPHLEWTPAVVQIVLLSVPTMLVSVIAGKSVLKRIDKRTFEYIVMTVIAFGAIRLLFFSS